MPDFATSSLEQKLLIACARRDLDASARDTIAHTGIDSISTEYLVAESQRHGLTPLVALHLGNGFRDAVRTPVLSELRKLFDANAAATLRQADELVSILKLLGANQIAALPYKGPALAMQAYGNIALRQSGDLDILVREKDFAAAASVLIANGYKRAGLLTAAREKALMRWGHHDLFNSENGTAVELHWRTAKSIFSFALDHDELWERTEIVDLAGDLVPCIGREDLLLMLAVHGSSHSWQRLEWVASYAELARQTPQERWTQILSRAEKANCARIVIVALLLASELLGLELSAAVEQKAKADPTAHRLAHSLSRGSFEKSEHMLGSVGYQFAMRKGAAEKSRLALSSLFTPAHEDWDYISLPDSLYPLYYVVRPIRLIRTYMLRLPWRTDSTT